MLNNLIQKLGKRIGINGKLSFHCGRRLFARICVEAGIPTYAMKLMMGKSIPSSDLLYIEGVDLTKYFEQLSTILNLEQSNNNKVSNIEQALDLVMKALRKMIEQQLMLTSEKGFLTDKEVLEAFLKSS
jgi:hypothetical protein